MVGSQLGVSSVSLVSARCQLGGRVVREVKFSITRSWVQNLSLPDERSNRETSRRIGFYSVFLVSLQGLPFTCYISYI